VEDIEVNEEDLLSDEEGNYAYLTFGGYLYTPSFLETIDKNICQNCEKCLEMCETRNIDEKGNVIPAFPGLCNGCGHCVNICPSKGIKATPIPLEEMIRRVRERKKEQDRAF
jgi:heterodisulfide reductase subunit A-like polyferredoxin